MLFNYDIYLRHEAVVLALLHKSCEYRFGVCFDISRCIHIECCSNVWVSMDNSLEKRNRLIFLSRCPKLFADQLSTIFTNKYEEWNYIRKNHLIFFFTAYIDLKVTPHHWCIDIFAFYIKYFPIHKYYTGLGIWLPAKLSFVLSSACLAACSLHESPYPHESYLVLVCNIEYFPVHSLYLACTCCVQAVLRFIGLYTLHRCSKTFNLCVHFFLSSLINIWSEFQLVFLSCMKLNDFIFEICK